MSAVPATRSLAAVLRAALDTAPAVRLVVGQFASPADPSNAYCSVIVQGATLRVPILRGAVETPGAPAYLLATKDTLLCLGGVTI